MVAFDIVMDVGRGDQDDRELVDACRNAGNVIMAAQVDASEDSIEAPADDARDALRGSFAKCAPSAR